MIVGIISDTHDRLPMIDEAVKRLNEMNVELVLHAGDYIAPFVASHFKPLKAPSDRSLRQQRRRQNVTEKEVRRVWS